MEVLLTPQEALDQGRPLLRRPIKFELPIQTDEMTGDRSNGLRTGHPWMLDGIGVDTKLPVAYRRRIAKMVRTQLSMQRPAAWGGCHVSVNRAVDAADNGTTANAGFTRFHDG